MTRIKRQNENISTDLTFDTCIPPGPCVESRMITKEHGFVFRHLPLTWVRRQSCSSQEKINQFLPPDVMLESGEDKSIPTS